MLFDEDDLRNGCRLWPPPRRPKPPRVRKIDCWAQLHEVMQRSPLLKAYVRNVPVYSVGERIVNAEIVEKALRWGLIVSADPGLFDDHNAQTFKLRGDNYDQT